jgi:hypothetical protein
MEQTDPIGAVIDRLCHTREELAQQLGVSPAALYSWSVGRRSPRPANRTELARIARAHARELTDLANALEGPGRRTPLESIVRTDAQSAQNGLDRNRVWKTDLKGIQARALEARMQARQRIEETRKIGGFSAETMDRVRGRERRP